MLLIDFTKLNSQYLNTTMADMGMADFKSLPFPVVLEQLNLGSDRVTEEHFSTQQRSGKTDLSVNIQTLRQHKKISDVIGSTKIPRSTPVCFSTFVGAKPKEYFRQYVEVAKILCEPSHGLRFVVWLEDTLTILKNGWDVPTAQQAIDAHINFFSQEFPESQIMLSSAVTPMGIPQGFAERLSSISTEEFLSVLPFHLRNPMFIKTLDVVHFAWNCYLLHKMPSIYLAGINNKRHFQLFRKVVGQQITVILLPLGSEDFTS